MLFGACQGTDGAADASQGNLNEISIIVSDVMWNGEVGDSLRKKLAAPVEGLVQEEPLFTLNQYREETFTGDVRNGRNIIYIKKDDERTYGFRQNSYCKPQNVFTISGKSTTDLLDLISLHGDEIIRSIKKTEIAETQQRNKTEGLRDTLAFAKNYGVKINVPLSYKRALSNGSFTWLKKEIRGGNTNLLMYTVPYETLEHNRDFINNIIKMRDSIGSKYIHGKEPGTYMVTEVSYMPSMFTTSFNDKRAFETRGNWEMSHDFMKGVFMNYAIRNDERHCYLIIEGFIYSPSAPKRDLIMELESIIESATFVK
ncbi:endonuclease [Flavobacterium akiainvivens]|uniref:Endonuclease n=1 Tax=Flavobacterium akiainvivens TaxID=1202724 RepID=A0A0M8MCI6_9FLAO|nr:endonuclease [Flavobacterium akiainvivens]